MVAIKTINLKTDTQVVVAWFIANQIDNNLLWG